MYEGDLDEITKMNIKKAAEVYEKFLKDFKKGICFSCNKKLSYFNKNASCLHWLLNPKGIKKKYFKKDFFKKFDLFQINSYLMWVAYQENMSININNLFLERDKNKIWETTIKYKNLKRAFSCSYSDFEGHKNTKNNFPHYHFLMGVNKQPFISFNDFHIPLTKADMMRIIAHKNPDNPFGFVHFWYIPGMEEIFDLGPNKLLNMMEKSEDEKGVPFHITSMIEMDNKTKIPPEKITEVFLKSKKTGKPWAKFFSEIPELKSTVIIEPSKGVPKLNRKPSRSKKKK